MNDERLSPEEAAANDAEIRALHAEMETSWEAGLSLLETDLNLLAWTLRHEAKAFDLCEARWWPDDVDIADHPDPALRWIAERDPIFYDLGRAQIAGFLDELADGGEIGQCLAGDFTKQFALAAWYLKTERPVRRGKFGDHLARDFLICRLICRGAYADNLWGLPIKRNYEDPIASRPTEVQISKHLFDLLNQHPLLNDTPDAIPSPESIRATWRSHGQRSDWPMPV